MRLRRFALVPLVLVVGSLLVTAAAADSDAGSDDAAAPAGPGVLLLTHMNAAHEIPGPGDDDGTGNAAMKVNPDTGKVCYAYHVRDIATATAAHLHKQDPGLETGPPLFNLNLPNARGRAFGCAMVSVEEAQAIVAAPWQYYVNVHNAEFPGGAVRGDLSAQRPR